RPNQRIYDVGGGKRPYLTAHRKQQLRSTVIGIDIDRDELDLAPAGDYDETVAADIATVAGTGDGDLVICQAVLEHVRNVDGAVAAIASLLKPGGHALVFVPCRNALFARLNLLLPERAKRKLLFALYPRMSRHQGFPSHYNDCTPSALSRRAAAHGLEVERVTTYWTSEYFYAFFPAYLAWRAWLTVARTLRLNDFCETFTIVLRKPEDAASSSAA
ncbi:MAG: methyltransferase domain-containing protein, partial [Thermomicrobiales bacterium]|nr:methyltransferase domain-containing protein [Thermomicrobiales bacterium]